MSDTQETAQIPENLPPLPDSESSGQDAASSDQETHKKKRSKLPIVILSFFILILVVMGLAGAYLKASGKLDSVQTVESSSSSAPLSPIQVANIKTENPQLQPSSNSTAPPKQPKLEPESSLLSELPGAFSVSEPSKPKTPRVSLVEDQPKPRELPVTFQSTVSSEDFNSLNETVNALVVQMSAMEGKLGGIETMLLQNRTETAKQAQDLAELVKKITLLQRKITRVSLQVEKRQVVSSKKAIPNSHSEKPKPPKPLSFAIWEGRDSVFVEHPKGRLKMLYEGQTVGDWRVVKINSNKPESVTYRSGSEVIELGLGE